MTWIKEIVLFEEGGKFKLKARNDWFTFVFPTARVRQWWIDNYYKKIGVPIFTDIGKVQPNQLSNNI